MTIREMESVVFFQEREMSPISDSVLEKRMMSKIQILGTGCSKCDRLAENARQAVQEMRTGDEVVKVRDIVEMLEMTPSALPALAIDGKVVSSGIVLKPGEIKTLILSQASGGSGS